MAEEEPVKKATPAGAAEAAEPPTDDPPPLRSMPADEFVRRLHAAAAAEKSFALFLGAGCSVSSGIPAAGKLVSDRWLPLLRDVEAPTRTDLQEWAIEAIDGYDPRVPARSYGAVINRLFLTADDRQQEIEQLCKGGSPSFGYAVLAQLMAKDAAGFNVVLTTNFDDLVADALYLYTEARPLVIHHDSLAGYIRPTRTRPLVVKLHGDHRLSPRNTAQETENMEQTLQRKAGTLLHDRGVIFLGYSGADRGILQMLRGLPDEALPYGAYWVHPEEPQGEMRDWLASRRGVWVRSGWFDDVMLLVFREFQLQHPGKRRFEEIFVGYERRFRELSESIDQRPADDSDVEALKVALSDAAARFPDFWRAVVEAHRLERDDPKGADETYRAAIDQFPDAAPLLCNYAVFLTTVQKDHGAAETYYKRAVDADPRHPTILGNYANYLNDVRRDFDSSEAFYKRAINADPRHAHVQLNYAKFLEVVRKDVDAAERHYKQACDAEPRDAIALGRYATFLRVVRSNYDAAQTYYRRAIEADARDATNLGNYALFLEQDRGDYDNAEVFFRRAADADPRSAGNLGNYAVFLQTVRGANDAAERLFEQAIDADPVHVTNLVNYALFLHHQRKDFSAAEKMYGRAVDAHPRDARTLGAYATFLAEERRDFDQAASMFARAIEAGPKRADTLGSFANFLYEVRKDYDAAEQMYKQAIELDSSNAGNLGNYAWFLQKVRHEHAGADTAFRSAIDADPNDAHNLGNYAAFLDTVQQDAVAAESMYRRAIYAAPGHARNLGNFALFLQRHSGDRRAVKEMFDRAVAADPSDAANLAGYANFLWSVEGNLSDAENANRGAVEADPANANAAANLARLLLATGKEGGLAVLDCATELLAAAPDTTVELETSFYRFAHGSEEDRPAALRRLRELLESGVRSPGWDLSRNVERAVLDGHADAAWLSKLAAAVNGDLDLGELNAWPAWRAAGNEQPAKAAPKRRRRRS